MKLLYSPNLPPVCFFVSFFEVLGLTGGQRRLLAAVALYLVIGTAYYSYTGPEPGGSFHQLAAPSQASSSASGGSNSPIDCLVNVQILGASLGKPAGLPMIQTNCTHQEPGKSDSAYFIASLVIRGYNEPVTRDPLLLLE